MQKPDGLYEVLNIVRVFYEHGIDEHLSVCLLIEMIGSDIVLGVSRAWAFHELSSFKFRKGLVSHLATALFVIIFYPFAIFMHLGSVIDTFIYAMMAAYGSSILANLSSLGVKFPYIDRYIRLNIDKEKFILLDEEEEEENG
ncbi:phage holin family protein [Streptococcus thermophilus]|uniref:phage holin family protein n=1 Tax=Streptococcus thermophilus TaxID=1308 RepID=UPI0022F0CBD6|nr:phage holin family protein [Streptococcus thermophilus]MCE2265863.1 holin [Streptococcus thermophilus]MDA3769159.1 phage holin family protein [Streptococcus thermophilus]MDA5537965.1 phage holin family protein [Streptococcus thermophilus]MDA5552522.1 phage holin family protein [Streptococcus thermophilus]WCL60740.1 phage holin family protein [Streptococcus thermophilus]